MTLLYRLNDAAAVAQALPALLSAPLVGLDTETPGLDPLSHALRLIQRATPDAVDVLDTGHADARLRAPAAGGTCSDRGARIARVSGRCPPCIATADAALGRGAPP